jgi:hypothetical protein
MEDGGVDDEWRAPERGAECTRVCVDLMLIAAFILRLRITNYVDRLGGFGSRGLVRRGPCVLVPSVRGAPVRRPERPPPHRARAPRRNYYYYGTLYRPVAVHLVTAHPVGARRAVGGLSRAACLAHWNCPVLPREHTAVMSKMFGRCSGAELTRHSHEVGVKRSSASHSPSHQPLIE